MRAKILFLYLLFYISGCRPGVQNAANPYVALFSEPSSFALDTINGYTINPLTGDSIKPLLNSFGDTVKTGVLLPFNGTVVDPGKIGKPKIVKAGAGTKTIIESNVHRVPDKLNIIPVDTGKLKKIKLGEGDQSFVLQNSSGIPTGVPIPITGRVMPFHEPQPVKAMPMRYKDASKENIQYLDVEQGMSYSFVLDVLEDKRGNLWFTMDGTGISKYDGVSFTHYSQNEGLSNNIATLIIQDSKGNLWIGTEKGVNKFDGKNFIQFTEKEGLLNDNILSLFEDSKGNIWFGTKNGLIKYDGKNLTHYTVKEGLPGEFVYSVTEDKNGNIWVGTIKGVAKFDGSFFTWLTEKDGLLTDHVVQLHEDKNGNLWMVSYTEGINKYDGKTITHYSEKEGLSKNVIWSVLEDSKGNMWFGTTFGGINKFDGKQFTHYNLKEGLSNSKVRDIAEDGNGNIWFGTDGGGVNKLNEASFKYLIPDEAIANNRIRPIAKDKTGNLWMGTEGGGVGKYSAEGNNRENKNLNYYTEKDGIILGQRAIIQDRKGNTWIGTVGGGVTKFDGANFTTYTVNEGISDNTVYCLLEDRKNNIWLGTSSNGIDKFDGEIFTHYSEKDGLPAKRIFSMLEDRHGNLWFCTEGGGIIKYDGKNIITYTEKEGLFAKSVTSVTEDNSGALWFGTLGAGVCKYDGKNFTYYAERNGLSHNNTWSIIKDPADQIWAGSDKGLNLFIPDSANKNVIYTFGAEDGLKAIDFNLRSVCIDDDNRIWWGTGKGIPVFELNREFTAYHPRSLSIKYIEVNEKFYDYRNLEDSVKDKITFGSVVPFYNCPENLVLDHDQNHLTFHFSAIDWSAPHLLKYSYRLLGLDNIWSSPNGDAWADFRNLTHGEYELQIKAVGRSQSWTDVISYRFTIIPPWWLTWWFKSIITILLLGLIFFVIRFIYLYQLRKQKAIMERQLAVQFERQRIFAEMHDDIGAGLSGVRLLTEMTKNKLKDGDASGEVDKIYQSVGELSAKMKEVIWSLNSENDSLSSLVAYLQKQARMMMENYPGTFSMIMPEIIPDIKITGDTRRHIHLLLKEALHNVIKHSGADKTEVAISCGDILRITVSDNGCGLNENSDKNAGNGMKNMHQRIRELNGVFLMQNKNGLKLTFDIPLK